jgi:hypothetical protein
MHRYLLPSLLKAILVVESGAMVLAHPLIHPR